MREHIHIHECFYVTDHHGKIHEISFPGSINVRCNVLVIVIAPVPSRQYSPQLNLVVLSGESPRSATHDQRVQSAITQRGNQ